MLAPAGQRGLHVLAVARGQRRGDVVEHRGQLGEHRRGRVADDPPRVRRQHERADRERDAPAEQRVDGACERDAVVGWLQRRHERGRDRRLLGEQLAGARAAAPIDIDSATTSASCHQPVPSCDHEQVGDRDAERHAEHDLDRPAAALALRQAERDHRRRPARRTAANGRRARLRRATRSSRRASPAGSSARRRAAARRAPAPTAASARPPLRSAAGRARRASDAGRPRRRCYGARPAAQIYQGVIIPGAAPDRDRAALGWDVAGLIYLAA